MSRLPVNSSHGHLVTRSCRHTVNPSPVNSSQTRLITQSTRHKRAHNKNTSTSRNYLHAVSLRRHPETVLNTDGVITANCVTLMISLFVQGQKVQKCILQIPDHSDRLHFYEKHGQLRLVTTPWNTTVNSSHDFTMWRVDHVTSWLVPAIPDVTLSVWVPQCTSIFEMRPDHRFI